MAHRGVRFGLLSKAVRAVRASPVAMGVAALAMLGIGLDLWLTGLWFSRMQVDPDLARVAGPVESYAHVLHDPFGFVGLRTDLRYPGAGRAMAHLTTKVWADHALGWVQSFVSDPVRALYLGLAITAVAVHVGFLVVGCKYLRAYQPMSARSTIFWALGLSLFVQLGTQRFYVGTIDHSMSYTFAYVIPLLVLAAFFLPVYRSLLRRDYRPSFLIAVALVPVAVYLAFSGPLIQPAVALVGALLVTAQALHRNRLLVHWGLLPGLGTLGALSAWGMYVSRYNSESVTAVSVGSRYTLLRTGLFQVLIRPSSPWPLMITAIAILYRLGTRGLEPKVREGLRRHLTFGLCFTALWLGLLPLGGYRNYRPFILSSVTLLPVTLVAAYLFLTLLRTCLDSFAASSKTSGSRRGRSLGIITFGMPGLVLCVMLLGKLRVPPENNACQRSVFERLHDQRGKVLAIPRTCPILTETVPALDDPDNQKAITNLLRRWNVIDASQTLK